MLDEFFALKPYELSREAKRAMLTRELKELTEFHRTACPEYGRYLDAIGYDASRAEVLEDIPFFPVRLFKKLDLMSVPASEVFKTLTSSGTTGQQVSKIYLDRQNVSLQQKVGLRLIEDFVGKKRLPLLIIDTEETIKNRTMYSARAGGIKGIRILGTEMTFALNGDMSLNREAVGEFLNRHGRERFLIFGFSFMVFQHLYKPFADSRQSLDLSQAILKTGGGWKKVDTLMGHAKFKEEMTRVFGITRFFDDYGMSEQNGSIYGECEYGHYHASVFSDVVTRRYEDFSPCKMGEPGIIQVLSVAPRSYPGHSLLTEDEGIIEGEDDCPCGRKGKYIRVLGRMKNAELRGCSNTYAAGF